MYLITDLIINGTMLICDNLSRSFALRYREVKIFTRIYRCKADTWHQNRVYERRGVVIRSRRLVLLNFKVTDRSGEFEKGRQAEQSRGSKLSRARF